MRLAVYGWVDGAWRKTRNLGMNHGRGKFTPQVNVSITSMNDTGGRHKITPKAGKHHCPNSPADLARFPLLIERRSNFTSTFKLSGNIWCPHERLSAEKCQRWANFQTWLSLKSKGKSYTKLIKRTVFGEHHWDCNFQSALRPPDGSEVDIVNIDFENT